MLTEDEEKRKRIKLIGIYATIPFILAVPPILGWLIGYELDKYFKTTFFLYVFLILGFIAGIRECYRIIKKYGNGE